MLRKIAAFVTWVFSPLLIPTYGTILLLYSRFHFSMFSWPAKRFLIIIMFVSTALMPALTLLISRYGIRSRTYPFNRQERWIPMIFIAMYYYLGFYLLNKMPIYTIFKVILLAGAILIVLLMMINLRWKLSHHMAAAGGLFGLMTALSLRLGADPIQLLSFIILLAGITGTSIMIRRKHNLEETISGFPVGFLVFFLIFYLL